MKSTRKSVKHSLLISAAALVLSIAMLIGTTFAWFTDSVTSGVNKIQAGNLKIDLQMKNANDNWVSAKNKTIPFLVNGKIPDEGTTILWEPGCTYQMAKLSVVNEGNLALKYKILITKDSSSKLNDVLEWKIAKGDTTYENADVFSETTEYKLGTSDNDKRNEFTLYAHMMETAGNEYKNQELKNISVTIVATQDTVEYDSFNNTYDEKAEYPTLTSAGSLQDAFADSSIDFSANNSATDPIVLDGKGLTVVNNWADDYFNSDTTIKGITFKNGASFTAKNSNITITLEDCTFYACDQAAAVKALGITDDNGTGNHGRNNVVTNTGAGMCLNLEQQGGTSGVKLIVKNCTFVGENDNTLPVYGKKYNGDGSVLSSFKKRGHAIALNAISGGGDAGSLDSMLIEGCVIDGVRGNAIQLYGKDGDITIKDTKINSWGVNSGIAYVDESSKAGNSDSYAVRGDYTDNRTLTLTNVYFGMDESSANKNHAIGHVKLSGRAYSGNTTGNETAGTYSK